MQSYSQSVKTSPFLKVSINSLHAFMGIELNIFNENQKIRKDRQYLSLSSQNYFFTFTTQFEIYRMANVHKYDRTLVMNGQRTGI